MMVLIIPSFMSFLWARVSVIGRGTVLQAGRSRVPFRVPFPMKGISTVPNPSSRTMALGLTQPLTEMSTSNVGSKARPARKADNLTAICEPIV
jgi:hypothetical protein